MSAKKRKNSRKSGAPEKDEQQRAADRRVMYGNILRLLCLIAATMAVFFSYRFLIERYYFKYVLTAYMGVATVTVFGYVIYNRGFSRKGVTPEMLPDTMSAEEKQEFIADGERRIRKSRPALILIFAFAFTFIFDVIELIARPFFKGLMGL